RLLHHPFRRKFGERFGPHRAEQRGTVARQRGDAIRVFGIALRLVSQDLWHEQNHDPGSFPTLALGSLSSSPPRSPPSGRRGRGRRRRLPRTARSSSPAVVSGSPSRTAFRARGTRPAGRRVGPSRRSCATTSSSRVSSSSCPRASSPPCPH